MAQIAFQADIVINQRDCRVRKTKQPGPHFLQFCFSFKYFISEILLGEKKLTKIWLSLYSFIPDSLLDTIPSYSQVIRILC